MPGILSIVATPIGNLEDITVRGLRVLREAHLIAAEDTRRTAGLLARFEIRTPLLSLHEHNERERVPRIVTRLQAGDRVALVTDAGTPLVSDPGALLVRAAIDAGVRVEAIPGPSAVIGALTVSGLPADTFTFLGFPPARGTARRDWIQQAVAEPRPVVFFEAPHRIAATLQDLLAAAGDRAVAIARELTKLHEEVIRGQLSDVLHRLEEPRGEFTVVLAPAPESTIAPEFVPQSVHHEFLALTEAGTHSRREAIRALASRYGRPARDVYRAVEAVRDTAHRPDTPGASSRPE